jgi:hypothetical protein
MSTDYSLAISASAVIDAAIGRGKKKNSINTVLYIITHVARKG